LRGFGGGGGSCFDWGFGESGASFLRLIPYSLGCAVDCASKSGVLPPGEFPTRMNLHAPGAKEQQIEQANGKQVL
jgi:hypothetical protein